MPNSGFEKSLKTTIKKKVVKSDRAKIIAIRQCIKQCEAELHAVCAKHAKIETHGILAISSAVTAHQTDEDCAVLTETLRKISALIS